MTMPWITFDRGTMPYHLELAPHVHCECGSATVRTHMQTGSIQCDVQHECASGHRFRVGVRHGEIVTMRIEAPAA